MTDKLQEDIEQYTRLWTDKMTQIWGDNIDRFGVIDTGRLRSLPSGTATVHGFSSQIAFQILYYGICQDNGVGNGYYRADNPKGKGKRDSEGHLYILDPSYRIEHKLGKKRKRRPWFSISWYISSRVMADAMQGMIGDRFVGLFDVLTEK